MPSPIVETATKGSAISAPLGADVRNAASVRTPFQSVGNRLLWLETFVTRIAGAAVDVITTALLVPIGNITLRLTDAHLIIDGDDDFGVHLGGISGSPGGVQFYANGNMASHLFTAGRTGRANKKVQVLTPGSGSTTNIDPCAYDEIFVTPAGPCTLVITPSSSPAVGDHIKVHALNGSIITVKQPDGTTTIRTLALAISSWRTVEFVNPDGGAVWYAGTTTPATA